MNGWNTNIVYVYTLHASSCETYMKKITYSIIPHA